MAKMEYAPPIPISNECVLCGDEIPDDTMQAPRTVCHECRRPVCVPCRDQMDTTGIEGCFYCETIKLKDTDSIQKALDDMRDKLLRERVSVTVPQVYGGTGTLASYRTDQPFPPLPEYGEDTPYSTLSHAMAGIKDNDQYPYRDGPDLMKEEKGWGVIPGKVKSVKMDVKGGMQGPFYGIGDREPHFVEGEQKVSGTIEVEDVDPDFMKSLMDPEYGKVPLGFATKSGNAGDVISVQQIGGHTVSMVAGRDVLPGDPITAEDLAYKREKSLRGSGRTTRFCERAFDHIKYAIRKGLDARVYYLTETSMHARHAKNTFINMVHEAKHTVMSSDLTVRFNNDRLIHFVTLSEAWSMSRGRQATMFIADLSEPAFDAKARDIKMYGDTIIENRNYYQVVKIDREGSKRSVSIPVAHTIETHPETGVVQLHELHPDPTREHEWTTMLKRSEAPPKSARANLKMRSQKKESWYRKLIPWGIMLICSYALYWVITR